MRRHLSFLGILAFTWFAACGDDSTPGNNDQPDAWVPPQQDARPQPDAQQCEDRCQQGDVQCVPGGYQVCGNYDADPCLEWGPTTSCDPGERCVDGECKPSCTDECIENARRCDPSGTVEGYQTCEQGADGCWHWSDTTACGQGESCSAGVCSSTCRDECNEGSRQCAGDGYQVCGDYDNDPCTEWGPITPCNQGETCSNGECAATCQNECTQGARRCDGTQGYQDCGNFDGDPCLEWSDTIPCDAGQVCTVDPQTGPGCATTCQDECQDGDRQCTPAGDGYQVCETNDAGCLAWSQPYSCPSGETCENGQCVAPCACDFYPGICEPDDVGSTAPCTCDPDCSGGATPCGADGHCDSWCPQGADPDCDCGCDYNEYCEAAASGTTDTCTCDPDCELHEEACSDDGHCDIFCPDGTDPDCGEDPCRPRWMSIGWRYGEELFLYGSYEAPDPDEGADWVLLSPGLSGGSGEIFVEFAAEHINCVQQVKVEVAGYDDSFFGDGAEVYLYNWDTGEFNLLPTTVGDQLDWYENVVSDPAPYVFCGTTKCYVNAKVGASAWDNTHVWWVELYVYMSN